MTSFEMFLDIDPVPKGRPRFGKGKTYTDAKTRSFERSVAMMVKPLFPAEATCGAVSLDVSFYKPIPKSWTKAKKEAACMPTSGADLDNYVKAVKDALNGIAYIDDSQVTDITAKNDTEKSRE